MEVLEDIIIAGSKDITESMIEKDSELKGDNYFKKKKSSLDKAIEDLSNGNVFILHTPKSWSKK